MELLGVMSLVFPLFSDFFLPTESEKSVSENRELTVIEFAAPSLRRQFLRRSSVIFANPKSNTVTLPSLRIIAFSGLMSP